MLDLILYKVYHSKDLLRIFKCPDDGIRRYYSTENNKWGKYLNEGCLFFDDNIDLNCKYIGLEQYGRSFSNITRDTKDSILLSISDGDAYTLTRYTLNKSIQYNYLSNNATFNNIVFFNDVLKCIDDWSISEKALLYTDGLVVLRSMFILTIDNFIKMRNFIRNTIQKLFALYNIKDPTDIDNLDVVKNWEPNILELSSTHRLFAFFIELLVSIWITGNTNNIIIPEKNKENIKDYILWEKFHLDIHVTEHCNLKCKSCCHYSNIADEEYIDPEKLNNNLMKINPDILYYFKVVSILGGEPLLHPNINEIIDIIGKYFNKNWIVLMTNGLLLKKMSDDFFSACKRNNIHINISVYNIENIDYIELLKYVRNKGVKCYLNDIRIYNEGQTNIKKNIYFSKTLLDLHGSQDIQKAYSFCRTSLRFLFCFLLHGTKLYPCPEYGQIKHFNKKFNTDLPIYDEDLLDLSTVTTIDQINEYTCTPKKFCKHCKILLWFLLKWELSKFTIDEYV